MALSAMEENIMQLAGRGGAGAYPYYQAANERKLATKRYIREEKRWEKEFGLKEKEQSRFDKLAALKEELDRANLALNQALSGRAETSAEWSRISDLYPSATPEARRETRNYGIGQGYIPESLRNELMIDPTRQQTTKPYPAAQAALYQNAGYGTPPGLTPSRSLYDIQNAKRRKTPLLNPSRSLYDIRNAKRRSGPSANAKTAKSGGSGATPTYRDPNQPYAPSLRYTQQELWDIDARAMNQYNASKGVSQDMMRRSYEAGGQTMKNGKLPPGVTPMTNMWGTGSDLRM